MSKIISRRSFLKRTALLSAVMSGGFNRIWALPKSQFIREVDDLT
ncbi:MAG: twin-arginine translocation signal domain-containing protein, partial [FCB group bacterium]|nr:twin-arginine translocation signal domain-containing protein [FCB group bacterium]